MITMEMLGKIRRRHLRDKVSLHEIAKTTGLSGDTIRRWLIAAEETAASVYRRSEDPGKLPAFHAALEQAVKADSHCIKQNPRSAKALFVQIKADGYTGGYCEVSAFVRAGCGTAGNAAGLRAIDVRAGRSVQFDWRKEGRVVGGIYYKIAGLPHQAVRQSGLPAGGLCR